VNPHEYLATGRRLGMAAGFFILLRLSAMELAESVFRT
jgi:hypothetical protein